MLEPCPTCGAPWTWTCRTCGSHERRPNGKGCAACHRRSATRQRDRIKRAGLGRNEHWLYQRLLRDDFEDVVVSPVARAYLAAFDAFLMACKAGDSRAAGFAVVARRQTLNRLEGL